MTAEDDFARAVRHDETGQLVEAERLFRAVLQRQPDHFGAVHRLGLLALRTGRFAEAADFLSTAVCLRPESAA
jgi:predicted Zn-dependent protease